MTLTSRPANSFETILAWILIFVGFALHVFAASRTWIGGDQAHLLTLGAKFASLGEIVPFGKLQSLGGTNPGILLQVLFGIPMYVIEHFRSPMIVVVLSHSIAFILLYRVVRNIIGAQALLPLALIYWLTPWRLYNGSLLWEPAFIFLPAALHVWSCYRLRTDRSFWASAWCIASIVWAMQIHNSFVILVLATIVLLWNKQIRLHLAGSFIGLCVAGITLIPSIIAIAGGELHFGGHEPQGFIGKGLVTVIPMLKGVLYWFNLGGTEAIRNLKETSFASTSAPAIYILQFICVLTVGLSILSSWWYFRPLWKWKGKMIAEHQLTDDARWLRSYALSIFIGLVISAALAPIVLQGWMVVIALHAACIPVVSWITQRWMLKPRRIVISSVIFYAVFQVVVMLVLIAGQYIFNRNSVLPDMVDPVRDKLLVPYIISDD